MGTFEEVTAVEEIGEGRYAGHVGDRWVVGGKPNGGYLQAVMARAAVAGSPHPHVIAASTHFLSSPDPGAVELVVEQLRAGRSASQVRVRLSQDQKPVADTVIALSTLAAAEDEGEPQWASGRLPSASLPFEDCVRFLPPLEIFPVPILHEVGVYLEPGSLAAAAGTPRGDGELRGWVELPDGAHHDPLSLLLAADVFPPATFDVRRTGWVPTLELSTYVRALPVPGPVDVVIQADLITGDRVDESVTVRDAVGRVVAQSHQLAGIRFGGNR